MHPNNDVTGCAVSCVRAVPRRSNGLVTRVFATSPGFGTIDYVDEYKQRSLLRAVKPEAQVLLDGALYDVGDLVEAGTFVGKDVDARGLCPSGSSLTTVLPWLSPCL